MCFGINLHGLVLGSVKPLFMQLVAVFLLLFDFPAVAFLYISVGVPVIGVVGASVDKSVEMVGLL